MINQQKLQLMQVVRAFACILVVLMHITVTFNDTYHSFFLGHIFRFGGAGVDVFFVLSGFIITYSSRQYLAQPSYIGTFLKRRIVRIFPIYWIIISFFLLLQILLPNFYRTHFPFGFISLLKTYSLWPGHEMVNGVSWSLTYEVFFYLLFIVAFLLPQKKWSMAAVFVYLGFLLLATTTSFVQAGSAGYGVYGLFSFPMIIEFLLGILIVFLADKFPKKWSLPLLVIGLGLFITAATAYYSGIRYNRVFVYGVPAFISILALVTYELGGTVKVNKHLLNIGDASYSIYLFHLPVVAALFKIMAKLPVKNHFVLTLASASIVVPICIAGVFVYKKVEAPLIKWLNKTWA